MRRMNHTGGGVLDSQKLGGAANLGVLNSNKLESNKEPEGGRPHQSDQRSRDEGRIERSNGPRSGKEIAIFAVTLGAIEKRFGIETSRGIQTELTIINDIQKETIGALEARGELSNESRAVMHGLSTRGINASNLTPVEAARVYAYATNATPEVVSEKVDRIFDRLDMHINAKKSRHDSADPTYFNQAEMRAKADLQDKYEAWTRGELDLERGFDVEEVYQKLIENGYDDNSFLRRKLEEDDAEDLIDEGLLDESSLYVYGPFTTEDLENMQAFDVSKWRDITDQRSVGGYKKQTKSDYGKKLKQQFEQLDPNDNSRSARAIRIAYDAYNKRSFSTGEVGRAGANLSTLIGDTIAAGPSGLEQDLLSDFVAREILQNRRLQAKSMLISSSSIAIEVIDMEIPKDDSERVEYDSMKRACTYLGYYAAQMLGYKSDDLKKRYGSSRPFKKEFFEELAASAGALTESRSKYLDEAFPQYLTKMDEHLHNVNYRLQNLQHESQLLSDEWD